MFKKVLIANRGEIACRIIRAAKELGCKTVAIYSDVDKLAQHVLQADEAYYLGQNAVQESYLNQKKIIDIAKEVSVDAIHPGYGLLSENAGFAQACENAGITFIGPKAKTIAQMADKAAAKDLAKSLNIPVIDSIAVPKKITDQWLENLKLNNPYIIKACAGGGGKGMRLLTPDDKDIKTTIELAKKEANNYFANDAIILERYIKPARHIEVQIMADQFGKVLHFFDRDCSLQRRFQKVIEEAPAPDIKSEVRKAMYQAAIDLAQAVHYQGAGTIEFLLDAEQNFYFLEMNTRVQVEHCVTEMVTQQDIVKKQFDIAAGLPLKENQDDIQLRGSAIEVRLCAEIPENNFMPSLGVIKQLQWPRQSFVRIDSGFEQGDIISSYYDSMLAKIIVYGNNREQAVAHLQEAMQRLLIDGIQTNQNWLAQIIHTEDFECKVLHTDYLDQYVYQTESEFPAWLPMGLLAIYLQLNQQDNEGYNPWHMNTLSKQLYKPQHLILYTKDNEKIQISVKQSHHIFTVSSSHDVCGDIVFISITKQQVKFAWQDKEIDTFISEAGDSYIVRLSGEVFAYHKYPAQEESLLTVHSGELLAPLPGSVVKVLIQKGDEVQKGDRLIVMEAMKMEHVVIAPFAGVIKEMYVSEGDRISLGKLLTVVDKKGC